jgi:hypothetical protein
MKTKAVGVCSAQPSLPNGADSSRPAAVKGAAEPRRSEPLRARTAGKESAREGRITGREEEFCATEHAERFFRGGMTSSTAEKSSEHLRPEIPKLTAEEMEGLLRRLNLARTRRIYADDGSEEGEIRLAREAHQPCLLAVRHLFRQQKSQEVAIGPLFPLRAIGHDRARISGIDPAPSRINVKPLPATVVRSATAGLVVMSYRQQRPSTLRTGKHRTPALTRCHFAA